MKTELDRENTTTDREGPNKSQGREQNQEISQTKLTPLNST